MHYSRMAKKNLMKNKKQELYPRNKIDYRGIIIKKSH